MTKNLNDKVALITGGARGIGKATVRKLAMAGCHVIINYFNSSDEAETLCVEAEQFGVKALAVSGNVADADSVSDMFATIKQHFDHIDFLINNAASGVLRSAMKMKLKHWHWCMDTNAFALVLILQHAKAMMPRGSRVIALSSLGAIRAIPEYAFIGASKAALESMVRALSIELAPDDIAINTVSAGVVDTDALKHFPNRELLLKQFAERSLAGRQLTPEDVADTIYLLCLPEAAMIRGQTIFVDAGYSIIG
ncbi:MAG: enoyl-[acyl-carrier-protein] reductase FabL [Legionellales bacterium]|nr:enoyl-[acyl-carrier-protein] reductase FabL [Legionellales bacterium]